MLDLISTREIYFSIKNKIDLLQLKISFVHVIKVINSEIFALIIHLYIFKLI